MLSVASLIGLTLVLFVYVGSLWQPLENLFVMVLPLGALSVAASITSTDPSSRTPTSATGCSRTY